MLTYVRAFVCVVLKGKLKLDIWPNRLPFTLAALGCRGNCDLGYSSLAIFVLEMLVVVSMNIDDLFDFGFVVLVGIIDNVERTLDLDSN